MAGDDLLIFHRCSLPPSKGYKVSIAFVGFAFLPPYIMSVEVVGKNVCFAFSFLHLVSGKGSGFMVS
jgi:hypothetical protein